MRNICRLCLVEAPITYPLLNNNFATMLEMLTSITLAANEEISTMCVKCSLNLKLAYTIQQNILRAHETLKNRASDNHIVHKFEESETVLTPPVHVNKERCDESTTKCIICSALVKIDCLSSHIESHFNEKQLCDLCNESFDDIETYRSHLQKHPGISPHKCAKCELTFRYPSLFSTHMKFAHKRPPTRRKKRPSKRLAQQLNELQRKGIGNELAKKLLSISNEVAANPPLRQAVDPISYKCDFCGRVFPNKRKLGAHKYGHVRRECPVCHKQIAGGSNFLNHVKNHDSGPQCCEQCGKTYNNLENLRSHVFYQHSKKKYECEECKITFRNRHRLNGHRKREHNGSGHICETCGRKFLFGYLLTKHIRAIHMKLRPFVCEFCNRAFAAKNAMLTHRRQHTKETPYKCEVCGEGFRQNVSLKAHKKTKHNIVEAVTCKCEVCGKGFASKHAVKTHMKCH